MRSLWSVATIIPARNESATIHECLRAVMAASDFSGPLAAWTVVVADDCTDDTAEIARETLGARGEVIECRVRSPGHARRRGTQAALGHFANAHLSKLWMANTDADTLVPEDWLAQHLSFADAGFGAVAGVVRVDDVPGLNSEGIFALMSHYEFSCDGTHNHVHGANLGVRADAYQDVGGWMPIDVGEDHCLWNRLRQRGWHTAAPTSSTVVTSGRLVGRAQGGFADLLRHRMEELRFG